MRPRKQSFQSLEGFTPLESTWDFWKLVVLLPRKDSKLPYSANMLLQSG